MKVKNNKSSVSGKYVALVAVASFIFAGVFFTLSQYLAEIANSLWFSFCFLLVIILFGIIADVLGTAVAAANEAPFHAKAAKKVRGAKESVMLVRNADRVANITNDVIGDIAGTVSGALGIALGLQMILYWQEHNQYLLNMLITALIASFTVGGKAWGKRIALSKPNEVIFVAGLVIAAVSDLAIFGRGKSK